MQSLAVRGNIASIFALSLSLVSLEKLECCIEARSAGW